MLEFFNDSVCLLVKCYNTLVLILLKHVVKNCWKLEEKPKKKKKNLVPAHNFKCFFLKVFCNLISTFFASLFYLVVSAVVQVKLNI